MTNHSSGIWLRCFPFLLTIFEMFVMAELQRSCVEIKKTSRRTTIPVMTQWQTHERLLGVCKKARFSGIMSGGNQAPFITCTIPTAGPGEWSRLRESWTKQSTEMSLMKTWHAQDLRLGRRFTFQQDKDPKHTANTTQEWLRDSSVFE